MTRHGATNDATRDTTERDSVSFEEAARVLGVSLRTVQRRVKDGVLNSTERDGVRLVVLPPDTTKRHDTRQIVATERDTAQAGSTPDMAAQLAQSREEILFLRGIVEQHQRSEAELRAALRESLKAMPKALPAGSTSNAETPTPEHRAEAPITEPDAQTPIVQKQAVQARARVRKLTGWQRVAARILGIRP